MMFQNTEGNTLSANEHLRRVLIIEDDHLLLETMTDLFSLYHYSVLSAPNGTEGVQLALGGHPGCIVCDVGLPDVDGFSVYTALQEQDNTRSIPFILVSGRNTTEHMVRAREMGIPHFISKPFDTQELMDLVQSIL